MKIAGLRWGLLIVAVIAAALAVFKGMTAPRITAAAAGGILWAVLSRRQARRLDRDRLGLPARSGPGQRRF